MAQMRMRYQFGRLKRTEEKTRRIAVRALHPPLQTWTKKAPGRPFEEKTHHGSAGSPHRRVTGILNYDHDPE